MMHAINSQTAQLASSNVEHMQNEVRCALIARIRAKIQAVPNGSDAHHALAHLEFEQLRWLSQLLDQRPSLVGRYLNALLINRVACNPKARELLNAHLAHSAVIIPLLADWWPREELFVLTAYVKNALEWLGAQQPVILQLDPYLRSGLLDSIFGLVIKSPDKATEALKCSLVEPGMAYHFIQKHMCPPSASLYHRTQTLKKNTHAHQFDELLARSPFVKLAAIESPKAFKPTGGNTPNIQNGKLFSAAPVIKGLSRSSTKPCGVFSSKLLQEFTKRHSALPEATFGLEYELYLPGLEDEPKAKVQSLMEFFKEIPDFFRVEEDHSLRHNPRRASTAFELVSRVLRTPEDISIVQNVLSRLNDYGAWSNQYSGVHIHTGIKQWNCKTLGLARHPMAAWWDAVSAEGVSRLQLRLIKQIVINFASTQHEFYKVSRNSKYNTPLGHSCDATHLKPNESEHGPWQQFCKAINNCKTLVGIAKVLAMDQGYQRGAESDAKFPDLKYYVRCKTVNTWMAFDLHGTIEFRGLTKAFSNHMEVDPNLPVRDLIYLQDMLAMSLDQIKNKLSSPSRIKRLAVLKTHPNMLNVTKQYVQDVLRLGLIHTLLQRNPSDRKLSMKWFVEHQNLFDESIKQELIDKQFSKLLDPDDSEGHRFVSVLSNCHEDIQPAHPMSHIRRHSLREAANRFSSSQENSVWHIPGRLLSCLPRPIKR